MSNSERFRVLKRELLRLKKQFLPKTISPTGDYSDRKIALTVAYRVLAHAEIEAYLEDRVKEVALNAKRKWDSEGKVNRTLVALVAFAKKENFISSHSLDERISSSVSVFIQIVSKNHGLKKDHLLALLLPIGIDTNDLDSVMLATMDTFGIQRGLVAHSSRTSYGVDQPLNPSNELSRIEQITQQMMELDSLISNLM